MCAGVSLLDVVSVVLMVFLVTFYTWKVRALFVECVGACASMCVCVCVYVCKRTFLLSVWVRACVRGWLCLISVSMVEHVFCVGMTAQCAGYLS